MSFSDRPILVTGAAGFIGYHTANALLDRGDRVVGIDNLNAYYSVQLKRDRLARLTSREHFDFRLASIEDNDALSAVFDAFNPRCVVNLAAQVGVRHAQKEPRSYVGGNLVGFVNLLELCRRHEVEHLVYASSSSVYGNNSKLPFSTADNVDYPISIYAATKKANELMAHSYSHLYRLPTTGLRFFTVYGPWGRPDMAMFLFTKALFDGTPIKLFNRGKMLRDFTYVSDTVEGIVRTMDRVPTPRNVPPEQAREASPYYRIYNIGNHSPVEVLHLIASLERLTGRTAQLDMLPMQKGEVPATFADIRGLTRDVGFKPSTPIEEGAARFVDWYRQYYGVT